jgi:ATPase subunit of ABC transporter with duplicated ATPase domains
MLQVHQLRKSFGAERILDQINFIINDGEHVGLIGPNGAGKSTLLRCIVGVEQPDTGWISLRTGARIGYLVQDFADQPAATVGAMLATAQADLTGAETRMTEAGAALATATEHDLPAVMARYDAALAEFEAYGGYERIARANAVLEGMGLGQIDYATPIEQLSGGQKTRLGLACLLLQEPTLLLLDEPTNHLDAQALEWLEGFVRRYPHAALIVSHDRTFLDRTITRILALDPEQRTIRSYSGGYSDYAAEREREAEAHRAAWQDQQDYIARVNADIGALKGRAQRLEQGSTPVGDHDMKWIRGGSQHAASKAARAARSRERKLERYLTSDERVERPRRRWQMNLDFGPPPPGGQSVLQISDLYFAYPDGPELFGGLTDELWHGERLALTGRNGSGKTTLLKLIGGILAPTAGMLRLGANVRPGVLSQEHDQLDPQRSVLDHIRATRPLSESEARSFLHLFLFGGDSVFRQVGVCSPGERVRLQLALLAIGGCNLLLLDEPLNHLDIDSREQFEEALDAFDATIVFISHDRHFVEQFAERRIDLALKA